MDTNKKNYTIAILMKSEVKKIDQKYTAGCERVFIQDILLFLSKNFITRAHTACQELSLERDLAQTILKLKYPHKLLDHMERLYSKSNFIVFHYFYLILHRLLLQTADFLYVFQFLYTERKSDIFYVFEQPLVALFFPKKTILTYHNFDHKHKSITALRLLFFFLKMTNVQYKIDIIFVSESLKNQFLNEFSQYLRFINTTVIYNSVNFSKFKYEQKNKQNKITFLYPSVWMKKKGILFLPKIIQEINKSFENSVEFIICGSVDLWSLPKYIYQSYTRVKNVMETLPKIFPNVKIKKIPYSEMHHYYKKATFTLFPSIWKEPFSLAVVESLACGTPVIAFNIGGTTEIITNNKNGYLVGKINLENYITSIKDIIEKFNSNKYNQLSKNAMLSTLPLNVNSRNTALLQLINKKKNS